tara:strand:+ start:1609 stop:2310 length:702 start_codon:yes stop_codon:yes gene_type:complete
MKHLRQTIRHLILENCNNVNIKITSAIRELEEKDFLINVLRADSDAIHVQLERDAWPKPFEAGFIKLAKVIYQDDTPDADIAWRKKNNPGFINCNNSYIVHHSKILTIYQDRLKGLGIGALLYDVALELAGEKGISPDRYSISDDSFQMYDYFYNNPDKYEKKYLDTYTETEPTEDDCPGESPYDYPMHGYKAGFKFFGSPLGYTYIKKDQNQPTIKCLDSMKLIFGNWRFKA